MAAREVCQVDYNHHTMWHAPPLGLILTTLRRARHHRMCCWLLGVGSSDWTTGLTVLKVEDARLAGVLELGARLAQLGALDAPLGSGLPAKH